MIRAAIFLLVLGGAGAAAMAATPDHKRVETIQRTGKWVANSDRDSCTVVAPMGEGRSGVAVKFTRYKPGEFFDLTVVGNRFGTRNVRDVRVDGTADFGVSPKPIVTSALSGNAGKYPALFFYGMRIDGWHGEQSDAEEPAIAPQQQGRVTGVTLALQGMSPLRLEFGSLAAPMTVMRACMDALVKRWGYDPVQQAGAQRHVTPVTRPQTWVAPDDFPSKAMRKGHNGIVQFRLDVDAEGNVAGCNVLARTNPDDFADITCRAISRRAKLLPALDAQGKPMRAFWVGSVRWVA